MLWELIDGAKHPNPQAVYRWLNSKIRAIHFSPGVDGWTYASTIIGTLIQCTVKCPLLLFAGGSVAGKGTGPNLQHLVAISPWLLIALARTSKQTTTCHVMSHLSESVRIYHQPHHQQQYDQTKITQYKTDTANNY